MDANIRFVDSSEQYAAAFNAAVGRVARERAYLIFIDAPPLETTPRFIRSVHEGGGVQLFVLTPDDTLVGWCDVVRHRRAGLEHSGVLGMALLPEYRGKGIGRTLAERTIRAAAAKGIERIELEVFASNQRAIRLYERLGFQHEGIKRNARKLDGSYNDILLMALLVPPATAPAQSNEQP